MFGARQRDIDSIGALNKFVDCQSSTEYDQRATHLQEAYRTIATFFE